MIIGFSNNTSRLIPKILCVPPRHCAPIVQIDRNHYIMFQFVRRGQITQIALRRKELKLLESYGWQFIHINTSCISPMNFAPTAKSCVHLCKLSLNMHCPFVLTPKGLYKKLKCQ